MNKTETDPAQEFDLGIAERILDEFDSEQMDDLLIPLLQRLQEGYGYLPVPVLQWVSRKTGIPSSRIHGVITFYSQFYTEPRGKHVIQCCRGTACHVKGAAKVIDAVRQETGLDVDGTSEDMQFTVETVSCLGACALAPLTVVNESYKGKMSADKARKLVRGLREE
jgi:NADH-quinone oxidoreductase subunit E